mmetsp:Transcript_39953/g.83544  ORF Transcript_39953/g.83544 Transcript_39953/m.83544 type:complete len:86 (+) Transcript_39953:618-875(+)
MNGTNELANERMVRGPKWRGDGNFRKKHFGTGFSPPNPALLRCNTRFFGRRASVFLPACAESRTKGKGPTEEKSLGNNWEAGFLW